MSKSKSGHDDPQVGDVITSPSFAYGHYHDKDDVAAVKEGKPALIKIDEYGKKKSHPMDYYYSSEERAKIAAQTGKDPGESYTIELGCYDESRGTAKFVIIATNFGGGSTGTMFNQWASYPNVWQITAKRLNEDGTYNREGETVYFTVSSNLDGVLDYQTVGHLTPTFS